MVKIKANNLVCVFLSPVDCMPTQDKLYKMAKSHLVPILNSIAHNPSEVRTSGTAFRLCK